MGMPSISITFSEIASTAIKRGERGIIAMILKDSNVPEKNPVVCMTVADIPETLSAESKEQITLALMGYVNSPKKVIAYVLSEVAENYTEALDYFKTVKFDYLVAPKCDTDGMGTNIVSYVKAERSAGKLIKAVLPCVKADNEGIINYTTGTVYTSDKEYTAEEYCSRIAGIIAGTPLQYSCTYAPLAELIDCTRLNKEDMDKAVDAGELFVWWDGEKVKISRGVNSLTTLTNGKGSQFQKIKILDAIDMISNDIRMTCQDFYIGKFANTYDNKCLLLSAIGNYFDQLILDDVLQSYELVIDIDANRTFLKDKGIDVDSMSDDDIKKANTGSNVFLKASLNLIDSIEDIVIPISI